MNQDDFDNFIKVICDAIEKNYPDGFNPLFVSNILCRLGVEIMKDLTIDKEHCRELLSMVLDKIYE